jgi:hypothetical protein
MKAVVVKASTKQSLMDFGNTMFVKLVGKKRNQKSQI